MSDDINKDRADLAGAIEKLGVPKASASAAAVHLLAEGELERASDGALTWREGDELEAGFKKWAATETGRVFVPAKVQKTLLERARARELDISNKTSRKEIGEMLEEFFRDN